MIEEFGDPAQGGFYNASGAHRDLLLRLKTAQDASLPSGNSMAAYALLRLGRLTGDTDLEREAERSLRAFGRLLEQAPGAFHQMCLALDLHLGPRLEIAVIGKATHRRTAELLDVVHRLFLPRAVVAWSDGGSGAAGPLLEGKTLVDGEPAAYVCRDHACGMPVTTPWALERALSSDAPLAGLAGQPLGAEHPEAFTGRVPEVDVRGVPEAPRTGADARDRAGEPSGTRRIEPLPGERPPAGGPVPPEAPGSIRRLPPEAPPPA
jgi:hypothetical protein